MSVIFYFNKDDYISWQPNSKFTRALKKFTQNNEQFVIHCVIYFQNIIILMKNLYKILNITKMSKNQKLIKIKFINISNSFKNIFFMVSNSRNVIFFLDALLEDLQTTVSKPETKTTTINRTIRSSSPLVEYRSAANSSKTVSESTR